MQYVFSMQEISTGPHYTWQMFPDEKKTLKKGEALLPNLQFLHWQSFFFPCSRFAGCRLCPVTGRVAIVLGCSCANMSC